ncbi:hypothetical protein Pst134EA_011700 [Puccinia striiformis f. sp. tritici]|uniref:hypothetical protein n=1 Tax=Puccinia striiformis f. sp. tritici TaxID=168172 RepID=UPI0020084005|nr:hypothetical protein Pst134EA_011700 [Puccinia striiformis f. sp. tritici]KAH9468079.1 hypothetical protein Pst134EA_011700 [Puccinia striiformis f. sp. tritici]
MDKDITAARSVAELSKSPDEIRKRSQRVQAGIDAELEQGAKVPLDATREAMSKLRESKNQIEAIKEEMTNRKGLPRSPKIASVSRIHRNFVATAKMVEQPIDLDYKIDRIEKLLAKDRACDAPNLLAIHYTLREANREASSKGIKILAGYFERLAGTIEAFESHYLLIASNPLTIFRKGHAPKAIKIDKMTEIKGQRAGWKSDCHSEDIGARFQSVRADSRIIKHYRAKFMNAVRTSAKLSDQKAVHQVSRSPCWGFRRKKLCLVLSRFAYCGRHAGQPYENIQSLVDKYLKLISKKMEEWTQKLMKSETRLFLERTEPPEEDADQMFTMQASGIMFQMIDFAIDSGQRAVLSFD